MLARGDRRGDLLGIVTNLARLFAVAAGSVLAGGGMIEARCPCCGTRITGAVQTLDRVVARLSGRCRLCGCEIDGTIEPDPG